MIRPYAFNKFNTSTLLFQYLDYLTQYLTYLEISLKYKRFYLDKKLHVAIEIYDADSLLFNQTIKISNLEDYKYFDNNLYHELDYYIISKELTFKEVRSDVMQTFSKLKLSQTLFGNGFVKVRRNAYLNLENKKNKKNKKIESVD